jgi:hypothetical protein
MGGNKNGAPPTSGPGWAIRLCPLCRGHGVASLITLRGTGDSDSDPVMFPRHAGCLDRDTPAREVFAAMVSAGATTVDQVTGDAALAAEVRRLIHDRAPEARRYE